MASLEKPHRRWISFFEWLCVFPRLVRLASMTFHSSPRVFDRHTRGLALSYRRPYGSDSPFCPGLDPRWFRHVPFFPGWDSRFWVRMEIALDTMPSSQPSTRSRWRMGLSRTKRKSEVEVQVEEKENGLEDERRTSVVRQVVSTNDPVAELCVRRAKEWNVDDLLHEGKMDLRRVLADETLHLDRIGHFSETDMHVALERFRELQTRLHGKLSQELMQSYDVLAKVSKDLQQVAEDVHNLPQISHEFKDQLDMYAKISETKWRDTSATMQAKEEPDQDMEEAVHSSELERIEALRAEMKLSEATGLLQTCTSISKDKREGIRAELGKDLLELAQYAGPQDMAFFHDCVQTLGEKLNYPELSVQVFIQFHGKRLAFQLQSIEDVPRVNEEQHNTAVLECIDTYFCTISDTFEAFKSVLGTARRGQQILAPFVMWVRGQSAEVFQTTLSRIAANGTIPKTGLEFILEHFTRQFAAQHGIFMRKFQVR